MNGLPLSWQLELAQNEQDLHGELDEYIQELARLEPTLPSHLEGSSLQRYFAIID
jgi:hypothetical protein